MLNFCGGVYKKSTILNIFIFKKFKNLCVLLGHVFLVSIISLTKLVHILFHITETQIVELAVAEFIDVLGVSIQARQFKRRYARVYM